MKLAITRLLLGALALLCGLATASADTVTGNFLIEDGASVSTSGGSVTLTLNGTIDASLTSSIGGIVGFAFDSGPAVLPESNFSGPITNAVGWNDRYGKQYSGFACFTNQSCLTQTSMSWTIGTPGEFSSVLQALIGTTSQYDFFLLNGSNDWAADAVLASPLPLSLPLFATGLAGLGLLGWRRKRKAQAV